MSQDSRMGALRFLAAVLDLDLRPLRALQDPGHPRCSPLAPANHFVHYCWTARFATLDCSRLFNCIQTREPVVRPTDVACTRYHRDAIRNHFLPHL